MSMQAHVKTHNNISFIKKEGLIMAKLKPGELKVNVEVEEQLWYDRKRVTIFALPWSFTKYILTPSKLLIESGLLVSNEEEVKLYRVTDIIFTQNLLGKINNTGTITILSNDTSAPNLVLKNVKNAKKIKSAISQAVEDARTNKGIKMSEVIGDVDPR